MSPPPPKKDRVPASNEHDNHRAAELEIVEPRSEPESYAASPTEPQPDETPEAEHHGDSEELVDAETEAHTSSTELPGTSSSSKSDDAIDQVGRDEKSNSRNKVADSNTTIETGIFSARRAPRSLTQRLIDGLFRSKPAQGQGERSVEGSAASVSEKVIRRPDRVTTDEAHVKNEVPFAAGKAGITERSNRRGVSRDGSAAESNSSSTDDEVSNNIDDSSKRVQRMMVDKVMSSFMDWLDVKLKVKEEEGDERLPTLSTHGSKLGSRASPAVEKAPGPVSGSRTRILAGTRQNNSSLPPAPAPCWPRKSALAGVGSQVSASSGFPPPPPPRAALPRFFRARRSFSSDETKKDTRSALSLPASAESEGGIFPRHSEEESLPAILHTESSSHPEEDSSCPSPISPQAVAFIRSRGALRYSSSALRGSYADDQLPTSSLAAPRAVPVQEESAEERAVQQPPPLLSSLPWPARTRVGGGEGGGRGGRGGWGRVTARGGRGVLGEPRPLETAEKKKKKRRVKVDLSEDDEAANKLEEPHEEIQAESASFDLELIAPFPSTSFGELPPPPLPPGNIAHFGNSVLESSSPPPPFQVDFAAGNAELCTSSYESPGLSSRAAGEGYQGRTTRPPPPPPPATKRGRSNVKGKKEEDGEDGEGNQPPSAKLPRVQEDQVDGTKLACPFFKHNPRKYKNRRPCCGPGWDRVHRIKEHIYRKHSPPKFSCPRCSQPFETGADLQAHARSPDPCRVKEPELLDGITQDQERKLRSRKKTSGKELTEAEKWTQVYGILFPDVREREIPSPYYNTEDARTNLSGYEDYLRRELPTLVRRQLEVEVERELSFVEEGMKHKVIEIARNLQLTLFKGYQQLESQERGSKDPSPGAGDIPSSEASTSFVTTETSPSTMTTADTTPELPDPLDIFTGDPTMPDFEFDFSTDIPFPDTQESSKELDPTFEMNAYTMPEQPSIQPSFHLFPEQQLDLPYYGAEGYSDDQMRARDINVYGYAP